MPLTSDDQFKWLGPPHLKAEVTMLTTENGGRKHPAFSGYRPHFHYAGEYHTSTHRYAGLDVLPLGQTAVAEIWFILPEIHVGRIHEGMPFEVTEASRVVGHGRVLEVLDLDQKK